MYTYLELDEVTLGGADLHSLAVGRLEVGGKMLRDGFSDLSLGHGALHGLRDSLGEGLNLGVDSSHSLGSAGLDTVHVVTEKRSARAPILLIAWLFIFINYKNKLGVSLYFLAQINVFPEFVIMALR